MRTVDLIDHKQHPGARYRRQLLNLPIWDCLDFGTHETELKEAPQLAEWLGAKRIFLKLETAHPTRTIKDRATELLFSYLHRHGITRHAHCSTGNTAASLVWGLKQYSFPFALQLFIAEEQLPHHTFTDAPGLRVTVLEGATYDQTKRYATWFIKNVWKEEELFSLQDTFRHHAHKIAYLEMFEQLHLRDTVVDWIAQPIAGGLGVMGTALAITDSRRAGWLTSTPRLYAAQPEAANPITRCFKQNLAIYDPNQSILRPAPSRAWAIRLGNASAVYDAVAKTIRLHQGTVEDATEEQIENAKQALWEREGVDAGYTASVAIAGLKHKPVPDQKNATIAIIVTGADRPASLRPTVHASIPPSDWQKVLLGSPALRLREPRNVSSATKPPRTLKGQ